MLDNILHGYGYQLWLGAQVTIVLALISLLFSLIIGLITALGKLSGKPLLVYAANCYTTVIRGVPDLVLMLLIFFGGQVFVNWLTAVIGYDEYINVSPFIAGVVTLSFIFGSYMGETLRGAILSVPKGQLEAAYSQGMSYLQTVWRILIPQMIRYAIPGISNNWQVLMKTTAFVSVIGLEDIVRKASLASNSTRLPFAFYTTVALFYLAFTVISALIFYYLEKRYSRGFKTGSI